jgi:hypothetical protein
MEICVLIFGDSTYWKLSPADPLLYDIRSIPGVQFISPILFPSIEGLMDAKPVRSGKPTGGYVGDLYLFETAGIAFKVDPDASGRYRPKDVSRFASYTSGQAPPLIEIATSLLSSLRHFSKQADMSVGGDDLNFWEWLELEEFPSPEHAEPSSMKWAVPQLTVDRAVTRAHIEASCAVGLDLKVPIFDTLFLDAISAHAAHDYRKSILYSAIALEAAVAMVLNERYETKVKPSAAADWRVIELPIAGGKVARKDPIWDLLKKREDANSLLHEGALYILGRSLLVENQDLFQRVQRLRATRNKIVHLGELPESRADQYLSIDRDGSSDALNCFNEVFEWLGIGQGYKLRGHRFVSLSNTVDDQGANADPCKPDID